MRLSFRHLVSRDHAVHLTGVQLGLVAAMSAAVVLGALPAEPAFAHLGGAPGLPLRASMALANAEAGATPLDTAQPDGSEPDAGVIRLRDMAPDAARLWNASNPISQLPNPAAKPFRLDAAGVLDEARAVDCMTAALYYEAANESTDGQRAVAQVVLNRMRHPDFPKTVCGVVFQGSDRPTGCQFSFTCDGALARAPVQEKWDRARKVAEAALHGYVMKKVGEATHYHADYVAPYWSPTLVKVGVIGAHIFYRWTGGAGLPPAFGGRYAGGESHGIQIATLDNLSRNQAKFALTSASEMSAPAAAPVEEAASSPKQTAATAEPELVTAASAAQDAQALTKAEDLDWQGRPKAQAHRLAMPSAGAAF
ncbi:MAG: sleB [Phenylobacterium sp.]|nr:sleB [Phenylobacterium sp.]